MDTSNTPYSNDAISNTTSTTTTTTTTINSSISSSMSSSSSSPFGNTTNTGVTSSSSSSPMAHWNMYYYNNATLQRQYQRQQRRSQNRSCYDHVCCCNSNIQHRPQKSLSLVSPCNFLYWKRIFCCWSSSSHGNNNNNSFLYGRIPTSSLSSSFDVPYHNTFHKLRHRFVFPSSPLSLSSQHYHPQQQYRRDKSFRSTLQRMTLWSILVLIFLLGPLTVFIPTIQHPNTNQLQPTNHGWFSKMSYRQRQRLPLSLPPCTINCTTTTFSKTLEQDHISPERTNHLSQQIIATKSVLQEQSNDMVKVTTDPTISFNTGTGSNQRHMDNNIPVPVWLQDYINFHQTYVQPSQWSTGTKRQRNRSYGSLQPPPPIASLYRLNIPKNDTSNVRTLTYHCNGKQCGGLGDRLFGIVQAFYIAVCTKRIFMIDYRDVMNYILPNHDIHWDIDTSNIDEDEYITLTDDNTILIRAMDDRTNPYLLEPNTYMNSTYHIRLQTNLWLGETFINNPCWQNYVHSFADSNNNDDTNIHNFRQQSFTADELFRLAFHTLFRWSEPLQETVSNLRQQATLTDTSNQDQVPVVVAMHIRTGLLDDKIKAIPSSIGVVNHRPYNADTWRQFLQCALMLQNELSNAMCETIGNTNDDDHQHNNKNYNASTSNVALYLATDHVSVKDYFAEEQGDTSIKMIRDLLIHHVDDMKSSSQSRHADDNSNENGDMMAWSELVLLQSSTCIVQSHSKYSSVSGILSRHGCAIYYDDCSDEMVRLAVSKVLHNQTTSRQCM